MELGEHMSHSLRSGELKKHSTSRLGTRNSGQPVQKDDLYTRTHNLFKMPTTPTQFQQNAV